MDDATSDVTGYRLQRENAQSPLRERLSALWAQRRWRWLSYAVGVLLAGLFLFWLLFARGLPDAKSLLDYQPPLPTVVRDINGQPVHSFARERRVQLQYSDFPPMLVNAYLAAEDKTFFSHHGVDLPGFAAAVFDYASKLGSGQRARGGSTITQQVVKNLFLWQSRSWVRKGLEVPLALWTDLVLSKRRILELYLNVAEWGPNGEFGVEAGAERAFGHSAHRLGHTRAALLAAMLPNPHDRDARRPGPGLRRLARLYVVRAARSGAAATACLRNHH